MNSTDPAVFFARAHTGGAMLPFGEHKGSGLALAVRAFCRRVSPAAG